MVNVFNQSLWGDEGFSAILSMKSLPEIIKIIANDTSPPLWNIFEWIVFKTLGTDEIYIRALAFLFFFLAVIFTYLIGKKLFDNKTGLLAAVLTFLNPFFFTYAFEGRMYSILAFGVTASMYFLLTEQWAFYVVATLWAMYSHHFAVFAVVVHVLVFLGALLKGEGKKARAMFISFIIIGVLYIPWLIPLYNQVMKVGGGFWLSTPTFADLLTLLSDYLAKGIKHQIAIPALIVVTAVLAFRRWNRKPGKTSFLLLWFLGPIILTWTVSQFFQSIFFNRYLLYTIPAATLILASNRRRKISTIFLGLLVAFFAVIDYHYFFNPTKIPFRELAAYVKQTREEGDFLVCGDPGRHKLWETKYYGIPAPIYYPDDQDLPFFVGTALMEEGDIIDSIPNNVDRLGVITERALSDLDLNDFAFEEQKNFQGIKFIWLTRK